MIEETGNDTKDMEQALYDLSLRIKTFSSSFDLEGNKPDLRNITYLSPTDHLSCPICQQPFMEPMTTICGHTFCKDCIFECLKMSKNYDEDSLVTGCCPLDRTPLDSANINDLFPSPLLISNLIDDLKVSCLNHERGCDWNGRRWELEHHVMLDCGYTGVKCNGMRETEKVASEGDLENDLESVVENDLVECSLLVERRFVSGECVHKLFECEYCNKNVTAITHQAHLEDECLFNYQTCDLCMNDTITLKNLEKHKANCSKVGHFKCPAGEIGCVWVGNNETALEIHLETCTLNQMLPTISTMNSKIDNLTKDNGFLQRQINKILDSIIQGKITNLGYNESIEEVNKFNTIDDQDKLMYLNFEIDRLKFEINEKIIPFINKSNSVNDESIINNLINDNFMMRDDMSLQRMMINSLRKQLQFLLFTRNRPMGHQPEEMIMDLEEISLRSSSEERLNLKL